MTASVLSVSLGAVRVDFYRNDEAWVSGWEALRGKRTRIPGSVMGLGRGFISHDLAQYIIEAAVGYEHGFWGLLSRGATFKSTGRRRTKQGRAVIASHRQDLIESEQLAGRYLALWKAAERNAVTEALSRAAEQFSRLKRGERLRFEWPSVEGKVVTEGSILPRKNAGVP